MPIPIIFDCDPGNDDAVALLITLASPDKFNVLGITTVAGNVDIEQTQINARKICELANKPEVKVYAGCSQPLKRAALVSDGAHGKTGLDGAVLPDPTMPLQTEHSVDFIIETLKSHPEPVTIFLTGPSTNMATAIQKEPRILENIKEMVVMGGSIAAGNITAAAEFNFFADPDAAAIVMGSGVKITLMTLDITHQVLATIQNIERLRQLNNKAAEQVANMMEATMSFDLEMFNLSGRAIHDACVPVYLLHPELYTPRPAYIYVETREGENYGSSLISFYPRHLPSKEHVYVSDTVKAEEVFNVILKKLACYGDVKE